VTERLGGHLMDSQGPSTKPAHVIQGTRCQKSVYTANICQGAECQQATMRQPEGDSSLSQESSLLHQSFQHLHVKNNSLFQNATSVLD